MHISQKYNSGKITTKKALRPKNYSMLLKRLLEGDKPKSSKS